MTEDAAREDTIEADTDQPTPIDEPREAEEAAIAVTEAEQDTVLEPTTEENTQTGEVPVKQPVEEPQATPSRPGRPYSKPLRNPQLRR